MCVLQVTTIEESEESDEDAEVFDGKVKVTEGQSHEVRSGRSGRSSSLGREKGKKGVSGGAGGEAVYSSKSIKSDGSGDFRRASSLRKEQKKEKHKADEHSTKAILPDKEGKGFLIVLIFFPSFICPIPFHKTTTKGVTTNTIFHIRVII